MCFLCMQFSNYWLWLGPMELLECERLVMIGSNGTFGMWKIGYDWVQWNFWNVKDLKSLFLIIEDENNMFHRNVGVDLQNCTVLIRRRLAS